MLKDKKVLVLGLAKSGLAATRLLIKLGALVTVNEGKAASELEAYDELCAMGVEVIAGSHPDELFERDFDFVVKNPGIKYTIPFVLRLQERNIPIYTEIELAFQVALPQHYVAITGTNGKTTTTTLVYDIVHSVHSNTFVAGNIGTPLCEVVLNENLLESAGNYIIIEMSNFQLLNIEKFKPEIATIINLTPDHLDYMRNVDEYYASKMRIYENQNEEDYFILNKDDATIADYTRRYPIHASIIPFSMDSEEMVCIKENTIYYDSEPILAVEDIRLAGKHNVQNVMIALTIAKLLDIPLVDIQKVIREFKGVEHRVEFVRELHQVRYYNDSKATNTDATIIGIKSFNEPLILLLGGFDKGLDLTELKTYTDHVKKVICFGAAGKRFAKTLQNDCLLVHNLKEATLKAAEIAEAGDVVLLSPSTSSYDEFTGYEQRGRCFKEIVNSLECE
ncbi:MAG: UDP-N-acetylmuramoyl-L-alanine--D-glutamate ligase [Beduini sp.]|uniref:UDP-N-acetylmuramoyl-L-alanine--D-glutamate ligase n=1 Tax=Beduini sp. TaxID=1922300 RepID=UPI0011CB3912